MPFQTVPGGDDGTLDTIRSIIGVTAPPPPAPSAPVLVGSAPTVSSTPVPGQGVALDSSGKLPLSILQSILQLQNPATRKIAFGTGSTTFPGGSTQATNAVVTHGMGVIPVFVVVTSGLSGSASWADFVIASPATTTTFTVLVRQADGTSPTAGTLASFVWAAIG